jgi:hypothetical protein
MERIQQGIDHPASMPAVAGPEPVAPGKDTEAVSAPNDASTVLPADDPSDLPP